MNVSTVKCLLYWVRMALNDLEYDNAKQQIQAMRFKPKLAAISSNA